VRSALSSRGAAAAATALASACFILPYVFRASHNPDEDQYAWSAAYFGKKLLAGDFSERGADVFQDPGWNPASYWGRSTGTRGIYMLGLVTPWADAPEAPYSYTDRSFQGPETRLDRGSLVALRLLALLCAVCGAALIALRFGWPGAAAIGVLLVVPQNAENFARAWAGGPLLLAFGLAAITFGSRWFPVVLGAVSTVKLTAIGLWPLLLVRAAHGWRSRLLALAVTVATWAVLTPPSWYRGGPGLLIALAGARVDEYSAGQSADGGLFLPATYFWPFELGVALAVAVWIANRRRGRLPAEHDDRLVEIDDAAQPSPAV